MGLPSEFADTPNQYLGVNPHIALRDLIHAQC